MTDIPTEILFEEIVPKLPAKSLNRFKSVSKSFNSLISSPEFVTRHLFNSLSSDANRLLVLPNIDGVRCFDIDSPDATPLFVPYIGTFGPRLDHSYYFFIGACNGLLSMGRCVSLKTDRNGRELVHGYNYDFVVVNPCTRAYVKVRATNFGILGLDWSARFGFGYDSLNDDYKVVGLLYYSYRRQYCLMVYTLSTKVWRSFAVETTIVGEKMMTRRPILIDDHILHWLFKVWDNEAKQWWCRIGCFDICTEHWIEDVPLPDYYEPPTINTNSWSPDVSIQIYEVNPSLDVVHIGALDGCLSLVKKNHNKKCTDVWIMKEYGVKESWIKLFGVWDENVLWTLKSAPLGYRRRSKSEVLVWGIRDSPFEYPLSWYKFDDRRRRRAKIRDIHGVTNFIDTFFAPPSNFLPRNDEEVNFKKDVKRREDEIHDVNGIEYIPDACLCIGTLIDIPGGYENIQIRQDYQLLSKKRQRNWIFVILPPLLVIVMSLLCTAMRVFDKM